MPPSRTAAISTARPNEGQPAGAYDPGSYRDRDGRIFRDPQGRILRALSADAWKSWQALKSAPFFRRAIDSGQIVSTQAVDLVTIPGLAAGETDTNAASSLSPGWAGCLEHEPISCISYPYEWPFGMLRDAARLHLELLEQALNDGFTIKDGTAYNVQWRGTHPVFIDVASLERLPPGLPWTGYRQFCQTFLYPLFLQAYKQTSFHPWLRGCLDGITPQEFNHLCSWRDLLRSGVFVHGFLHARLQGSRSIGDTDMRESLQGRGISPQMVRNTVRSLLRLVERLNWRLPRTNWSDYTPAYSADDWQLKETFVRAALQRVAPDTVWDLGCNTGHFSRIAAETANTVIAVDGDHVAIEKLYRELRGESAGIAARRILPLVSSVVDPSPNQGWRGAERSALEHRSRPDLVLCLALIHHVVLGAGVPLSEFLDWVSTLGPSVVVEFVSKDDPQAQRVLHNRRDNYFDYSWDACEQGLRARFGNIISQPLSSGTRTLVLASHQKLPL